ncbi:hypothetical protein FB639_004195, partial [Coemansia asiatica]
MYSEEEEGDDDDDDDLPHLFEEHYFENLLIDEIRRLYNTGFDGVSDALLKATKRKRQTMAVDMENEPEDTIQRSLCADIVATHFSPAYKGTFNIGTCSRIFDTLDTLARKPVDYWLSLLKTWLLDQKPYHVIMIPDEKMGDKLEARRREIEMANAARIPDKEAHAKAIARAIDANKVDLSDQVKSTIAIPDPSLIVSLPHTQTLITPERPIGPASVVQSIECDSEFPCLRLYMPMDKLPDSLRAYLVLFQELIFSSDLVLPAGLVYSTDEQPLAESKRIDYVTVDSFLAEITTSYSASVGEWNELFSCSKLDEVFLMAMRMYDNNYSLCARWFTQIMMFSQFSSERILSIAQNLLSSISSTKREETSVSNALSLHYNTAQRPDGPRWAQNHISIFEQEALLKAVVRQVKSGSADSVIKSLDQIRDALIHAKKGFLAIGTPIGKRAQTYVEEFSRQWSNCYEKYMESRHPKANGKSLGGDLYESELLSAENCTPSAFGKNGVFPIEFGKRFPDHEQAVRVHFPLSSLQASRVQIRMKNNTYRKPTGNEGFDEELQRLPALEYYALYILTELLSRTDGPLYNAIRGKGYSYGAVIYPNLWTNQLIFECYRASDAPRAILAMRKLLVDIGKNWDKYVGDFEISAARSATIYQSTSKTCTPIKIVDHCISSNVYGFESAKLMNRWRNEHLAAV